MTDLIAGAGVLLMVVIAYIQIRKHHYAAIWLQENHLRNELKVRVYDEFAEQLHHTGQAVSKASGAYQQALRQLSTIASGVPIQLTMTSSISEAHFAALRSLSDLQLHFEKYEIAFARFGSIRATLSDEIGAFRKLQWPLHVDLVKYLPIEGLKLPAGTTAVFPMKCAQQDLERLERLAMKYRDAAEKLQGYILDTLVESQNELLGDVFQRIVPPRHPADGSVKVLRRDADEWL